MQPGVELMFGFRQGCFVRPQSPQLQLPVAVSGLELLLSGQLEEQQRGTPFPAVVANLCLGPQRGFGGRCVMPLGQQAQPVRAPNFGKELMSGLELWVAAQPV